MPSAAPNGYLMAGMQWIWHACSEQGLWAVLGTPVWLWGCGCCPVLCCPECGVGKICPAGGEAGGMGEGLLDAPR